MRCLAAALGLSRLRGAATSRATLRVWLLGLCCPVLMQPAAGRAAERDGDGGPGVFHPERRMVFSCLAWDEPVKRLYYRTLIPWTELPKAPAEARRGMLVISPQRTDAPVGVRSVPQGYLGPASIEFFGIEPSNVPVPSAFRAEPVARTVIPITASRCLFLFFRQAPPPGEPNLRYRIEVIPDSLLDIPHGSYHIFNSTNLPLLGAHGKARFDIGAGSMSLLKPELADSTNEQWRFWEPAHPEKPIHSAVWRHRKDGRYLIFIGTDGRQPPGLTVRAITEFGEPPAPAREPPRMP